MAVVKGPRPGGTADAGVARSTRTTAVAVVKVDEVGLDLVPQVRSTRTTAVAVVKAALMTTLA